MGAGEPRANLVVLVDDFSKFTLLRLVPDLASATMRHLFESEVVWVYGRPRAIRTDGGSEFRGEFAAMCVQYGVEHVRTQPYSPWRNGRAERMIKTTKGLIRKMAVEEPDLDWREALPQVQGAINFTVARATGYSAAEVFLGYPPFPPLALADQPLGPLTRESTE